jgi:hypothetical protein
VAVDKWEVPEPIYQFLATTGKGATTGHSNAVGDYSTATGTSGESFVLAPSTGEAYHIERMMVHLQDTGAFAAEEYGNLGVTLTKGVTVRVATSTGTVNDLTGGNPVLTNAQWGRHCYDVRIDSWSVGDEFLSARWTFSKAGFPVRLDGDRGEYLEVYLQNSCTGLVAHEFLAQGYVEDAAFDLWQ